MSIGASSLAPFPNEDTAAAGIEIPQGDPDALRAAARAWADAAELLTARTPVLDGATVAAGLASWSGAAADAFMMASRLLYDEMRQTARDAAHAAPVCRRLATVIEHAQDDARAAIADAKDAIERIEDAKHTIEQASREAAEADHRMQAAQASAQTARGLTGVLGEPAAQIADQQERAARTHGLEARARIQRASAQLATAESDLRRARHCGEAANRAARQAGRTAAAALAEIAGAARRPTQTVRPPLAPDRQTGEQVDPLAVALAIVTNSYEHGTVTALGVEVDMNTRPSEVGDDALTGVLVSARRRAQTARARAIRSFAEIADPSSPLARGRYADTNRRRLDEVRAREIKADRTPASSPASKLLGKVLRGTSRFLNVFNPVTQFRDNEKKDMPLLENALRTGLSASFGQRGAAAGAWVCAAGGPVPAAGCAVGLGYLGATLGDVVGGGVYKVGDRAVQNVEPLVGRAEDALDALGATVKDELSTFGRGR